MKQIAQIATFIALALLAFTIPAIAQNYYESHSGYQRDYQPPQAQTLQPRVPIDPSAFAIQPLYPVPPINPRTSGVIIGPNNQTFYWFQNGR